jgi:hypothetical protein
MQIVERLERLGITREEYLILKVSFHQIMFKVAFLKRLQILFLNTGVPGI